MKHCDEMRDDILPSLGISLEDKPTGSLWRMEDKEKLLKEKEEKFANK